MIRNVSSVHINERNALKMHVVEEDMPNQQYATATAPMITPATNVVNQNISLAYILRF